jgi:hypothetical protein
MSDEIIHEIEVTPVYGSSVEPMEDDFETIADYHRKAAMHFAAAAKLHLLAAGADDEGDEPAMAMHAYHAYRHQLNAVQYAEIAVMESDASEEIDAEEDVSKDKVN